MRQKRSRKERRLDGQRYYGNLSEHKADAKASEAFHRKAYQVGKALREQGAQMERKDVAEKGTMDDAGTAERK